MEKVIFDIPGDPQGKARPRVVRLNGRTMTFTPDKTVAYEELVRARCYGAMAGRIFTENSVKIRIEANFAIPKSTTKGNRMRMIDGVLRPNKKPDWDNVGKIVCDAMNGVAYKDDSQIVDARVIKRYTDGAPYVRVEITEV